MKAFDKVVAVAVAVAVAGLGVVAVVFGGCGDGLG